MKLYKFRPLTELLFKELYYKELYFASYFDLNDPLDLKALIDFTPKTIKDIEVITWLMIRTCLNFNIQHEGDKVNNINIVEFCKQPLQKKIFEENVYKNLQGLITNKNIISIDDIIIAINLEAVTLMFNLNIDGFKSEVERLVNTFFVNSAVTCFSETNSNPLMWSHYASKHSGICIEFNLENEGQFPYILSKKRSPNYDTFKDSSSEWETNGLIYWDNLTKVTYQERQPVINFFDFSVAFINEGDCDLMEFSKSWTHKYYKKLQDVVSFPKNRSFKS